MKNYITVILALMTFVCISCTDEQPVTSSEDGDRITLTMGVDIADMADVQTRAFKDGLAPGEYPPLWVVVFDASGYLTEYVKAGNFSRTGNITTFEVTLKSSPKQAIIHFLLNYSDNLALDFGHESVVIGSLTADSRRDVYWQRKVVSKLDQETASTELSQVPLIRNFAKIRIINEDPNFILSGYALWHDAASGTVAPYHKGEFMEYINDGTQKSYEDLVAKGYAGFIPDNVTYNSIVPTDGQWLAPGALSFVYEHPITKDPATAFSLLIKGRPSTDTADTYYKADFVNFTAEGYPKPFHILRNFEYQFVIKEVHSKGRATVKEAVEGIANNNLSGSVNISDLRNISDGVSALYVSHVDTVLVSTDKVELRYKYIPDLNNKDITDNGNVHFKFEAGDDRDIFEPTIENHPDPGWARVILTPKNEMPIYPIDQKLIVSYTKTDPVTQKKLILYREVNFELRPEMSMRIECTTKNVLCNPGEKVDLNIYIPLKLNKSMFPMGFSIESQERDNTTTLQHYISPNNNEEIDIVTGPSIVPGFENTESFSFKKWLTYDQYKALPKTPDATECILKCSFVTNTYNSSSDIYVDNIYFTKQKDYFNNTCTFDFVLDTKSHTERYGTGNEVKIQFAADKPGTYTLSSSTLSFVGIKGNGASMTGNVINVSKPGVYTITCKTTTWSGIIKAMITRNDGVNKETTGKTRNVLYTRFKSGNNAPYANSNYYYYDVNIAKNGTWYDRYPWSKLTDPSGFEYVIDNLKANDQFMYYYELYDNPNYYSRYFKSGKYNASDLANKTIRVNFTEYW